MHRGVEPCWKQTGVKGYAYEGTELTPDGGRHHARGGCDREGADPTPGSRRRLGMPVDLTTIVVQIQNSEGLCWGAVYNRPPMRHSPEQFKGVAD